MKKKQTLDTFAISQNSKAELYQKPSFNKALFINVEISIKYICIVLKELSLFSFIFKLVNAVSCLIAFWNPE